MANNYFPTLGDLGRAVASRNFTIVDPPTPLSQYEDGGDFGNAWVKQPAIRKVVGYIARQLATTPLQAFELSDDGKGHTSRVRLRTGPLADLLKQPDRSPGSVASRFWEAWFIDLLIHDRAVALIEYGPNAEVQLRRIPARHARFFGERGRVTHVEIPADDGSRVKVKAKHFLLDRGYSSGDGLNGSSPVRMLEEVLRGNSSALRYRQRLMDQAIAAPGMFSRPADAPVLSEEAKARVVADLASYRPGGVNAGREPLLEEGTSYTRFEPVTADLVMDLEARRLTDEEVCAAYYIFPELLGIRKASFANMEAMKTMLYATVLGPYYQTWNEHVNAVLVPAALGENAGNVYVEANIEAKMRGSFAEQAMFLAKATGGPVMTTAEARERQNLPFIEGTEEILRPLNYNETGDDAPELEGGGNGNGDGDGDGDGES